MLFLFSDSENQSLLMFIGSIGLYVLIISDFRMFGKGLLDKNLVAFIVERSLRSHTKR